MNKFLVYFLMMFLLVLVGGAEVYASLPPGNVQIQQPDPLQPQFNPEVLLDTIPTAAPAAAGSEAAETGGGGTAQSLTPQPRPQDLRRQDPLTPEEQQVVEVIGDAQNPQEATQRVVESDLPPNYKNEALRALTQDECGEGMFSFFCTWFDRPQQRATEQFRAGFSQATKDAATMEEHNEILRREVSSIRPSIVSNHCSDIFSSECSQAVRNVDCQGRIECEQEMELFQIAREEAINQQRIPNSGMIRAAQMLRITPQASAASSMIQDLLGIEVSLIQEGSGIDQILRYGTPEQICFAKVDSFISVNGLQVEGQVMEVDDEITGMSSVLRACDNRNFQICADLRAERSGIYFNNSFTLFVHVFVRNAEDFPQMVTLHAELKSGGGREERVNVVELSEDVPGKFILLSPGQTFSRTLYLPETQVFMGEELKELYGNIVMGVFEAVGVSEQLLGTSSQSSNSGPDLSNIDVDSLTDEELSELMIEIERNENPNQDAMDSASQGGLVYALDYPILTLRGSSGSNIRKEVEMSGANITSGTTQQSIAVVRRVSLD